MLQLLLDAFHFLRFHFSYDKNLPDMKLRTLLFMTDEMWSEIQAEIRCVHILSDLNQVRFKLQNIIGVLQE